MHRIILKSLSWATRKLDLVTYLTAENLALRQQLLVLKRGQQRPGFLAYNGAHDLECAYFYKESAGFARSQLLPNQVHTHAPCRLRFGLCGADIVRLACRCGLIGHDHERFGENGGGRGEKCHGNDQDMLHFIPVPRKYSHALA